MTEIQYTNLERVLSEYGDYVAKDYKDHLAAAGKTATGKLYNTVRPFLEEKGGVYDLYLAMQDYWKYIEYGTRLQGPYRQKGMPPGAPMRTAILDWIKAKPVIPYAGKDGRVPTPKQLAFLIARKIYEEGTPPFHFLTDSLTNLGSVMARCEEAVQKDLENWLAENLENV